MSFNIFVANSFLALFFVKKNCCFGLFVLNEDEDEDVSVLLLLFSESTSVVLSSNVKVLLKIVNFVSQNSLPPANPDVITDSS